MSAFEEADTTVNSNPAERDSADDVVDNSSQATLRANRHQRSSDERSEDEPRKWTRSHSPLRQLLDARPRSRAGYPHRGICLGQAERYLNLEVSSISKLPSDGADVTLRRNSSEATLSGTDSNASRPARHQTVPSQEQRVCMKDVFRPMIYDECHVASEQPDDEPSSPSETPKNTVVASDTHEMDRGKDTSHTLGPDQARGSHEGG